MLFSANRRLFLKSAKHITNSKLISYKNYILKKVYFIFFVLFHSSMWRMGGVALKNWIENQLDCIRNKVHGNVLLVIVDIKQMLTGKK